jgi:hypothetical protein
MNKLRFAFVAVALLMVVGVCQAKKKHAQIKYEQTTIDVGTFSQDDPVQKCTFKFYNVGDAKLYINYVHTSCGCTVADFPKDPISPGGSGEITVTYDGTHKMPGKFKKTIQVFSNCKDELSRVYILGNMSALTKEELAKQKKENVK